ncbi:amino acid adenylation domain-containing protein [Aliiruegeria haliotis]|uniref:Amino acid adenylation domain-containing protein n=1 Tax=Aliiruegeria haliotis TaxID=1280846 RepID=A0A2T0RVH9_9RHOB|nr:hybrid non-ribosomal peptide synthetase/type I polyketide synthase [Aliiruegeria haliotis]PRY25164.1 amino acid adenylation domain-containing protein [Aliiruegeria haliotis]
MTSDIGPYPDRGGTALRRCDMLSVFGGHCRRAPDAPAIVSATTILSYAELDTSASRVAASLRQSGVRPGDWVGLLAARSVDAIVAILGILKAGAAYVPLDPTHAPEQIPGICDDLGFRHVLVAERWAKEADTLLGGTAKRLDLSTALAQSVPLGEDVPPGADDLAYVMYTSGSTGRPKGVLVTRRGVRAFCNGIGAVGMGPDDVVLHCLTIACDGSTFDIWSALLNGACIAIVEEEHPSLDDIARVLVAQQVTAVAWYAGLHHLMIDHRLDAFASLRLNLAVGDVMSAGHVARLIEAWPQVTVLNGYGPTETTVGALHHRVGPEDLDGGAIPIGVPFEGYEAFVVDEHLRPLPSGQTGQLVLAGPAVALGYHNRAEKTAEVFVDDPREEHCGTVYLTGDLASQREDGAFIFSGRVDRQVKLHGRRIELDGIEHVLRAQPGVRDAAVVILTPERGEMRIAAALLTDDNAAVADVLERAGETLHPMEVPRQVLSLDAFPLTTAGKVDRKALERLMTRSEPVGDAAVRRGLDVRGAVAAVWDAILGCGTPSGDVTFFDAGGSSLQLIDAHSQIEAALGVRFPIAQMFETPRFGELVAALADLRADAGHTAAAPASEHVSSGDIAIVGMAARLPGVASLDAFWEHIRKGDNLFRRFDPEELDAGGPDRNDPAFVPVRPSLDDVDMFDARHFGILPKEAQEMDPQARIFLELCQLALDDAGIDPSRPPGPIALYAGSSPSTYLLQNLFHDRASVEQFSGTYQLGGMTRAAGNNHDSLVTRVAHKLNLKGPAINVGTMCSTSLTAIAQAVAALRAGQADAALAGGVSITFPQRRGYIPQEGGIGSLDGVCRPFDAAANGTVFGSGAGVVVLRRLEDALADGYPVLAVIRGVGINNDGSDKISYTAPSVEGQANAIRMAHRDAALDPSTIGYVECHGTATPLGDPVELSGLARAFEGSMPEGCALGSVKGTIGHLDAAAGVASVIKTVQVLRAAEIPPVPGFTKLNPRVDLSDGAFRVPDCVAAWQGEGPRRAGVSSFGVGGTNVHLVLEEAPDVTDPAEKTEPGVQALPLSARSPEALAEAAANLADALDREDAPPLDAAARTLQDGRHAHPWRLAVAGSTTADVVRKLRRASSPTQPAAETGAEVVFMFPGQGSQYPGMGRGLYEAEPGFAKWIDHGAEILRPIMGDDLTGLLTRNDLDAEEAARALRDTRLTQPALYLVQYACAHLWMERGVRPMAMIGHSVGEFTAAALAGVMEFETGLRIIAARGQHMQDQPGGAMLSVRAPLDALRPHLGAGVDLAAMNAPKQQVVAGPFDAIKALEARLSDAGIAAKRLHTSHAFHSAMMDPVVEALEQDIRGVILSAPEIPLVSSVTGTWMTDEEAQSPAFWAAQARAAVNFQAAVKVACEGAPRVLLEVGAGATLSTFSAQVLGRGGHGGIVQSLTDHTQTECDVDAMASAFANLWAAGVPVDWARLGPRARRRCSLPGTVFRRKRYWVDPPAAAPASLPEAATGATPVAATGNPAIATEPKLPAEPAMQDPINQPARADRLREELLAMFSDLSGEALDAADVDVPFLELGFDSLFMGQVSQALEKRFGVQMSFRSLLSDTPSIAALCAHLDTVLPEDALPPAVPVEALAPTPAPQGPVVPLAPPQGGASADGVAALMQSQLQAMQTLIADQLRVLQSNGHSVSENAAASPQTTPQVDTGTPRSPDPAASSDATAKPKGFRTGRGPDVTGGELDAAQRAFVDDFARRYSEKFAGSKASTAEHRTVYADPRTVSGFRPEWKELTFPLVVGKAKGAEIEDVDGNHLIDLVNGFGQTAFGHSPDFVSAAVMAQMERGYPIGPQADMAGPVARKFARATGHERVTFCNTGSEAVMAAMRLARAATGRERIAVFSGDYHGQFDEVLVKGRARAGEPTALPIAPGIPRSGLGNMVVLPYGDPAALDWLRDNAGTLAAALVEPVQSRHPAFRPADFVREVRQITKEADAALIMDEVVTGFRTHIRGMQGLWGIEADLATYGKVVGGGMPVGVLAGRARFMDVLDGGVWAFGDDSIPEVSPTFFAGTNVRHPLVLAAVDAVLDHLEAEGARLHDDTAALTERLVERMRGALARRGLPDLVETFSSWFILRVSQHDPRASLLYALMRYEGVHVLDGFGGFLTTAHTDEHADTILQAFETALDTLQSVGILQPDAGGMHVVLDGDAVPTKAIPLTEAQREVWMTHQLGDAQACSFNEGAVLHLDGELDRSALQVALDGVMARHDALRAVFDRSGSHFDVVEPRPFAPEDIDLSTRPYPDSALAEALDAEARLPLDITNDLPIRARLYRLGGERHVLLFMAHHIACDGWSYGVLFEELSALYSAACTGSPADLPPAPSFARHARDAQVPPTAQSLEFWQGVYEAQPDLPELPTDAPRPAIRSYAGATTRAALDKDEVKAIRRAGAKQGCTLFATLFAALQFTLGRLSGAQDIVLGVPTGGQAQLPNPNLVGHLVNMLPIRAAFDPEEPAADHLKRVSDAVLRAFDHQDTTYGALVRDLKIERSLNRMPLTEVQFNLEKRAGSFPMAGLTARPESVDKAATNFDLFFNMAEVPEGLQIEVDYNSDLYAKDTVDRWIGHLVTVLRGLVEDMARPVRALPLLDPEAEVALAGMANDTGMEFDRGAVLQDLVTLTAKATPEAIAVEGVDGALRYADLEQKSDALAALIQQALPEPGERVAVALPRGGGMLVGLLAVLKAGHAYVPLDPAQPDARLRQIVQTAGVSAVLAKDTPGFAGGLRCLSPSDAVARARPAPVPRDPEAAAYVIFTSGSTGTPKGVEIPHRAVVNFLTSMAREPGLSANDTLLSVTTVMFDIAVLELFGPLVVGGRVVIADRDEVLDGFRLVERLEQGDITCLQATPTLWSMLLEAGFAPHAGLRMLAGGEPIASDLADRLLAGGGEVWNMYGPTETTIWSAVQKLAPGRPITIGHPIGNTELHVVDDADALLPLGAVGELNIGGAGLALGYDNRPDLTGAAFRDVTLGGRTRRLYRTGDLARRMPNGEVRVLGRRDTQIKLRGFRIELGDIETRLRAEPNVAAAAVALRERANGDRHLVAYLVAEPAAEIDQSALAASMARQLPDYMQPRAWVVLTSLPQTGNGKLDRKALPDPQDSAIVMPLRPCVAADTNMERRIVAIWQDVLGGEQSVTDTLHAIGADSLDIFRIAARLIEDGLPLEARDVLAHPSVRDLAKVAESRSGEARPTRPSLRDYRHGARRDAIWRKKA